MIAFFSARALRTKLKFVLFNPILIAITLIILFLVVLDIPFEDYNQGGKYLTFFLGPSIVAFGVVFYEKYHFIKHNIYPFLLAVCGGGLISILVVSLITIVMNAPDVIIIGLMATGNNQVKLGKQNL